MISLATHCVKKQQTQEALQSSLISSCPSWGELLNPLVLHSWPYLPSTLQSPPSHRKNMSSLYNDPHLCPMLLLFLLLNEHRYLLEPNLSVCWNRHACLMSLGAANTCSWWIVNYKPWGSGYLQAILTVSHLLIPSSSNLLSSPSPLNLPSLRSFLQILSCSSWRAELHFRFNQ